MTVHNGRPGSLGEHATISCDILTNQDWTSNFQFTLLHLHTTVTILHMTKFCRAYKPLTRVVGQTLHVTRTPGYFCFSSSTIFLYWSSSYCVDTYFEMMVVIVVVIVVVTVVLVVKEVGSRKSWMASLPPATSLCVPVLWVAPAAHSTPQTAGKRELDVQVQNGQPGVWWSVFKNVGITYCVVLHKICWFNIA